MATNYLKTIETIGNMTSNNPEYNTLIKKADGYYDELMDNIKKEVKMEIYLNQL